ncbi:IclR family transcriptional regulator [Georgenia ruanii]|uniref:Helix-turn-helix domain-containing protein n=1 Tax=Georgenia ruanii TaxID=348442 RepID=A0A7J9UWW2_9MICO|nr:IclR family transcriptional regulator [Georgenia ruanii]MPV88853.1 helix-turn-helix domain-containing protein [Georgenia ruanii]
MTSAAVNRPRTGSPVEAVDRALLVLQALAADGPGGSTLAELAGRLEVNKTTLHRVLAALKFRDFVVQDPASGRYALGPSVAALADQYFGEDNLPALLHPALLALVGEVDELVHLGALTGAHVLYLDKVEPDRPIRVWSAVGRRMPAVTTALGRALLAYRGTDRAMLDSYLPAAVDRGAVDADHVWATLELARARGYAMEDQENEPGITCVAVPLLRAGTAVAAVSVTAPAERMGAERVRGIYAGMRAVLPALLPPGLRLPDAE